MWSQAIRVLLVNMSVGRTRVGPGDRLPLFDRLIHDATGVPGVAKATASAIALIGGMGLVEMLRLPVPADALAAAKCARYAAQVAVEFANLKTPFRRSLAGCGGVLLCRDDCPRADGRAVRMLHRRQPRTVDAQESVEAV